MRYRILIGAVLIGAVIFSTRGLFAATRFDTTGSRPVADGGTFFTVFESPTLSQWQWSLGTSVDYGARFLDATLGGAKIDIVKRMIAEHFYSSLGLTDWLEFNLDLPVVWHDRFINPDTLSAAKNELGLGDLGVALKFRLLNREQAPIGLALVPFATIPTGKEKYFIAEDGFTGGGKLIIDGKIKDRVTIAMNVGGLARKHFNGYGLNFDEQFLLSGGLGVKVVDFLSVVGEMETRTPFGDFFDNKKTSPTEGRAGLQWRIGRDQNIIVNTGGGVGITYGTGTPRYRAFAGLTYVSPRKEKKKPAVEIDYEAARKQIEKTVHFRFGSSKITDETARVLGEVGNAILANSWIKGIIIEGYTDSTGSKRFNERLGMRRANAVKKFLKDYSVDPAKMETASKGERNPAATNKTREGRAKNRRVEIKIKD